LIFKEQKGSLREDIDLRRREEIGITYKHQVTKVIEKLAEDAKI
jgi:hypothetical protein